MKRLITHAPQEVIQAALIWRRGAGFTFRRIVNVMDARGILVSHTTVSRWDKEQKDRGFVCSPDIHRVCEFRNVRLYGREVCMYTAVNYFDENIDFIFTVNPNRQEAERFFRLSMVSEWLMGNTNQSRSGKE